MLEVQGNRLEDYSTCAALCQSMTGRILKGTVWRILDDLEAIGDAPPIKNRCGKLESFEHCQLYFQ